MKNVIHVIGWAKVTSPLPLLSLSFLVLLCDLESPDREDFQRLWTLGFKRFRCETLEATREFLEQLTGAGTNFPLPCRNRTGSLREILRGRRSVKEETHKEER